MGFDFIWIGVGIAAGYFIGDGLKNFKNPEAKDSLSDFFEDDEHELIQEKNVHFFIGISKEDAKTLLAESSDVPKIEINGNIYYPKEKLRKYLQDMGA